MSHYPVMLPESMQYLEIVPEGIYLDATLGLGGHSAAIARQLTTGRLVCADRDQESLEMARAHLAPWQDKITFEHARFSQLPDVLKRLGIHRLDGLLADLGTSYHQLTSKERGFSFTYDGQLDMRMDRSEEQTAADLVNYLSEKELADIFYSLGEERRARRVAKAIVRGRPVRTTSQLADIITRVIPRTSRINPCTKCFQALRQAVNREPQELEALLTAAPGMVRKGKTVVILSFMSTDDRLVKRHFQALARAGRAALLTRRVVKPSEDEIRMNAPSRSARLRAIRILED